MLNNFKRDLRRFRKGFTWGWFFTYSFMIALVVFTSLPLVYLVVTAFKPLDELYVYPPRFFVKNPTVESFGRLFTALDSSVVPFSRYLFNSVFVTICSVAGVVLVCSMGAYALDKIKFPGRDGLFRIVILALMYSPPAAAIPIYMAVSKMGLINNYLALILPGLASPMYFFLLKQFISQVPNDIIESGRIDGASEWRIYRTLVMPMCKAAISTVIVFCFTASWNDAAGSTLYITNQAMKSLPYAIASVSGGSLAMAGAREAASLLTTLPTILIYVAMQARVIRTMAFSGIKG